MLRYMMAAVAMAGIATQMPALIETIKPSDPKMTQDNLPAMETTAPQPITEQAAYNPLAGRTVRIRSDNRGHFYTDAKMNNRAVKVLVDTGATLVAINETTARRLGIRLTPADFKYRVSTANGVKMAAAAMIDEIEIGRVVIRDVQASVSRDTSLDIILLGMSFLNKLKRFEISSNTLILTQ